jgi:aminoglycoside 3-N-acetyltransferase
VTIGAADISDALERLGVRSADTLFVHSGLRSSLRVAGATAHEKLATVLEGLRGAVPAGTLVLPTFSYSFCRGEVFDVDATPSTVGALSEWFRRRQGVRRTAEPIFSAAVEGPVAAEWNAPLFTVSDKDCFGPESIFAYLRATEAKLLFYGVGFESCTYVHHVEQTLGVGYRYVKDFAGTVRAGGVQAHVTARYFVRNLDDDVEVYLSPLGERLQCRGGAQTVVLPGGPRLLLTNAAAVGAEVERALAENADFLLRRGHVTAA